MLENIAQRKILTVCVNFFNCLFNHNHNFMKIDELYLMRWFEVRLAVFFIVQVSLRSTKPESNAGAVAGGIVAVLIVLVVVGVLSVFYIR